MKYALAGDEPDAAAFLSGEEDLALDGEALDEDPREVIFDCLRADLVVVDLDDEAVGELLWTEAGAGAGEVGSLDC